MGILKKKTVQTMHKHNLYGCPLLEKHEMFWYQMLGFSVCMVTMRKPFARFWFVRILGTDFCTDFARIFVRMLKGNFGYMDFCVIFCTDFCMDFFTQFLRRFLGVSETACWEEQKFSFTGEGLGGQGVRRRRWPNRPKGGWGGTNG